MPRSIEQTHRSGPLKQENKAHKHGRHRTNRGVDADTRGRIETKLSRGKVKRNLSKADRRHQAKQLRAQKRAAAVEKKRNLGSGSSPPFVTSVVSLCEEGDASCVLANILSSAQDNVVTRTERNITFLGAPRFKQRFCFLSPRSGFLYDILDAAKVSDTLVLVWPLSGELSRESEALLSSIFAQGLPATIHTVQGFAKLSSKQKESVRKLVNKGLERWSFEEKFGSCDSESDGLNILRQIGNGKKRRMLLQERRPQILVEKLELSDTKDSECTLKAYGFVRGPALDVNGLIHIPGCGDFQMKQIDLVPDPYRLDNKKECTMEECVSVLGVSDPARQASLQSEVIPDPMAGEQTWPSAEEIALAEANARKKVVKKVPKGTSEYQATWIVDEEAEDTEADPEEDPESDEDDMVEAGASLEDEEEGEDMEFEDAETMTVTSQMDTDKYDDRIDITEEKLELERFRKERENEMFPDEIDTPLHTPARVRFQK